MDVYVIRYVPSPHGKRDRLSENQYTNHSDFIPLGYNYIRKEQLKTHSGGVTPEWKPSGQGESWCGSICTNLFPIGGKARESSLRIGSGGTPEPTV